MLLVACFGWSSQGTFDAGCPHILAFIGFLILSGMGNICSCLDTHSVSLGFSKIAPAGGWPTGRLQLLYSITLAH